MTTKTNPGNFFEDFKVGDELTHATPRTVNAGDVALYQGLFGSRFALQSSDAFARHSGLPQSPVDDWLTFHVVFGKTVPDVSLNAVANLGYAEGRFLKPVYVGDTLSSTSEVIGLKENSNGKTGVVYVRTSGKNQRGEEVLSYVRWVMVNKRDHSAAAPEPVVPELAKAVPADQLVAPQARYTNYNWAMAGSKHAWGDYEVGEKIDHVDGMTIEEAEHMIATRLYQNTAKVHFNQHQQEGSRFGKRLIYGGHVISLTRALTFNGLENAQTVVALNAGAHVAPCFAGDTVYAWSEVMDKAEATGRDDVGFLRLRTVGMKNEAAAAFPYSGEDNKPHPAVILDLDVWVALPR